MYSWVLITLTAYVAQGYLSAGRMWLPVWILGALPLWALVAKYSEDIPRDAVIYDVAMLVGFQLGLFLAGSYEAMKPLQILGICMAVGGILIYIVGKVI